VSAALEQLGTGFLFTEGPLWHPRGKFLLFSDMPGDHMRRWSATDGITTFRKPCDMSNGLTYDRQGRPEDALMAALGLAMAQDEAGDAEAALRTYASAHARAERIGRRP